MQKYTDPYEAMTVANSILVKRGLCPHEGEWTREIISYDCNRVYEGGVHYEVSIHLTAAGFNAVKEQLGPVDYTISSWRVAMDPYVRIKITLESVLHLLVLVLEEECDAIVAL